MIDKEALNRCDKEEFNKEIQSIFSRQRLLGCEERISLGDKEELILEKGNEIMHRFEIEEYDFMVEGITALRHADTVVISGITCSENNTNFIKIFDKQSLIFSCTKMKGTIKIEVGRLNTIRIFAIGCEKLSIELIYNGKLVDTITGHPSVSSYIIKGHKLPSLGIIEIPLDYKAVKIIKDLLGECNQNIGDSLLGMDSISVDFGLNPYYLKIGIEPGNSYVLYEDDFERAIDNDEFIELVFNQVEELFVKKC